MWASVDSARQQNVKRLKASGLTTKICLKIAKNHICPLEGLFVRFLFIFIDFNMLPVTLNKHKANTCTF